MKGASKQDPRNAHKRQGPNSTTALHAMRVAQGVGHAAARPQVNRRTGGPNQMGGTAKGRGGGGRGGGAVSTSYAEGPGRLWRTNNGGVCVRGEGLGVVHTCTFPIPPADYAHPKEGGGKEREDDLQKCLSVSMTMEYMGWGGAALHYSITGWSLGSPGRGRVAGTALQSWR